MRRPRGTSDGDEDPGEEEEEEERRQAAAPPGKDGPGDALWRWRTQSLSEVVLSWSVDQILDKDLLRDKVRSRLRACTRPRLPLPVSRSAARCWAPGVRADDPCGSDELRSGFCASMGTSSPSPGPF
jgi:hypothetical protein